MTDQDYFQFQKGWEKPLVHLSMAARQQMLHLFLRTLKPDSNTTVLDVGTTSDTRTDSNFFEKHYPFPNRITCTGLEQVHLVKQALSGFRYVQIGPQALPFKDRAFAIGASFAVIEHVGNRENQKTHVAELFRVCEKVFITTPNRRFPFDPHTMLPLLHYLPRPLWHSALRYIGRGFYATEDRLNPLDKRELRALFPPGASVRIEKIRLCGMPTNLVAIAEHPAFQK